jgi:hypothetical protein
LKSIVPIWEKNVPTTGEKPFYFTYDSSFLQVRSVTQEEGGSEEKSKATTRPSITPFGERKKPEQEEDPDEAVHKTQILLSNNHYIDPAMIEMLTKQQIGVGVAGNRFFNPFVWERAHFFRLSYDSAGRVRSAREERTSEAALYGRTELEFTWNGSQLTSITGYELSPDDKRGRQIYQRTMNYSGGRLMSELISGPGKPSRIEYKYSGDRLVTAVCDEDSTLDSKSRVVTFSGT